MLDLTEKAFKVATIDVFKELKETIIKEVKEDMTLLHQIENIDKEVEIIIKY